MTDTPETDKAFKPFYKPPWRVGLGGLATLISEARRLERQRDAYAETLREIAQLSIWLSDVPLGDTIRERHPELAENE